MGLRLFGQPPKGDPRPERAGPAGAAWKQPRYKAYSYPLLTRSLLYLKKGSVQLACVTYIASVHPEQGSNSSFRGGAVNGAAVTKSFVGSV